MNPKVFVCHASEDKERFVLDFAIKLRSKGIDAWVDRWEIYPGDSLVDKIFEEGINNAQAVIIILSKDSVGKPWVREELNASMIKKIQGSSKLIPVVIDDCQIPECLISTIWEKIKDLKNYDAELDRIVMSIYGQYDKPPIGTPPSYTQTVIDVIPNLTRTDSLVLKLSCEKAVEIEHDHIDIESIWEQAKSLDIPQEAFLESLKVLDSRGYLKATWVMGSNLPRCSITIFGFEQYARVYIRNYNSILKSVAFQIVNNNKMDNKPISSVLNQPQMIVDHILSVLEQKRWITVSRSFRGYDHIRIDDVSPELKRFLKET